MRIWHDNTGSGASASWFLKYIIVQDLQNMQKFHFVGQRWLAVEKEDGKVGSFSEKLFEILFLLSRSNVFCLSPMN